MNHKYGSIWPRALGQLSVVFVLAAGAINGPRTTSENARFSFLLYFAVDKRPSTEWTIRFFYSSIPRFFLPFFYFFFYRNSRGAAGPYVCSSAKRKLFHRVTANVTTLSHSGYVVSLFFYFFFFIDSFCCEGNVDCNWGSRCSNFSPFLVTIWNGFIV